VRDFADVRIRGVPGEYDRIDAESYLRFEQAEKAIHEHGADFMDVLRTESILREFQQGCIAGSQWLELPWDHVRREGMTEPMYQQAQQLIDAAPQVDVERGYIELAHADSGWFAALEHFVRSFLQGDAPHNADALDASVACVTAMEAVESVKTRQRVDLSGDALTTRRAGPTNVALS